MKNIFCIAILGLIAFQFQWASAATFVVTNALDSGTATLREAVTWANSTSGTNTIEFQVSGTIAITSPLPVVRNAVMILGPGADSLTIMRSSAAGTADFRVLEFDSPFATMSGVRIANGAANEGAGIWNKGHLTLSNCVISGNASRGSNGKGAGIRNSGRLVVSGCIISNNVGNTTGFTGGGIHTDQGHLTVVETTITGNSASQDGGGVYVSSSGATVPIDGGRFLRNTISGNSSGEDGGGLSISSGSTFVIDITNCTFSGNQAQGDGGGIESAGGIARVIHCTIVSNTASGRGGGLYARDTGSIALGNTIVARNQGGPRPDIAVASPRGLTSLGHNLIGDENSAAQFVDGVNGDIVGNPGNPVNPLLGPLQMNLGPTFTHALLPGSRAINAGSNSGAPTTDQRGLPRIAEGVADIGAFESNAGVPPTITCPANIVRSNAPGTCGAVANFSPAATGLPAPVITTSIPSGSTFPVGSTTVTCTASNAAGVAQCSFTVTVIDAEAPTLTCPASMTVAETVVGAGTAMVTFPTPAVADNCGSNLTVTFVPASGSAFPAGTTPVTCTVTDAAGNTNSCSFTVSVLAYTVATVPSSQITCPGDSIAFVTTAQGTGPFIYAWNKDGQLVPNATNSTLILTNLSATDAGAYCAVVSGALNSVTNCATLTIRTNTSATALTSLEVCPGTPVQFSTIASGTGPFAFSWFKDGSPITDATNSLLELTNVINGSEGTYSVVVQGFCTAVTNSATLTVWTNTTATALTSLEVCPGTPVSFSTIASGTGPFAYSWLKDGSPIFDATNALLELTNVVNGSEGAYSVVVQGLCTSVTNSATLTVWSNTAATALTSLEVCPGTPVSFSTIASGTGPFAFAWFKDGSPITDATNALLELTNVVNGSEGVYSVVVQGLCTAVTNSANLTVWTNTSATALTSLSVCPGEPVLFSTIASGTGPFAFAWFKDGSPITDATNALLELTNVINGSEGVYSIVVQGLCTAVTNSATLTVWTNTSATVLTSLSVCPGEPVLFSTVASGTGPFAFAWFKDGSPLPGETNASFALSNAVNTDGAVYSVVVQGLCTAVTNSANLTVWTNTFFLATPPVVIPPKQTAVIASPAQGTGPFSYQWFRDNSPIVGQTNDTLILTNVSLANEGFYCVVATGFCSTATNCVEFGIQRDGVPPQIASATILCADNTAGITSVMVEFSEEVVPATALNQGSYSIAGRSITNISEIVTGRSYLLQINSPFLCGYGYSLQAQSVLDLSGETIITSVTNLPTGSLPCCNNSYVLGLPAGHSLVANQLDRGFNTLSDILPVVPEGSTVRVLKSGVTRTNAITANGYPVDPEFDVFTYTGGAWSGNPVIEAGSGFFIFVPTATNIVMTGSIPVVNLPLPFPNSAELVSRQIPAAGGFEDIFGAPPIEGIAIYRHVTTNNPTPILPPTYQRHLFRNGVWEGGFPSAGIGESWLVQAIQPVVITTNPVSQTDITFGSTISFQVSATGSPELIYQWRHNGLNIPGATNSTLVITNVQLIDGGAYSVTVGNFFNTVESSTAVLSLLVFDLPDLPLTNYYADRVVLTAPSGLGNSSNVGANKEPGEPDHAGKPGGKSMWIDWQAPASGIATFATTGSSFDTLLAVYTNSPGGLVEVASDEESGGFLTSKLSFYATAGQTYSIAVDGFGAEQGLIVLGWSLEATQDKLPILLETPVNLVVGVGDTVIFTALASGQDIRYQWFFNGSPISAPRRQSPGNKEELRIKNAGPQDAGLYWVRVFEGSRFIDTQPISLQFNMEGLDKRVRQTLSKDKLLDVLTIPAAFTELYKELTTAPSIASATASATVQRSYTGTQILNTYGSVKQPGEPNHCGIPGGASQWYLYEAPENGIAFINTDGSTFDTVLAVYIGPGDSFTTLTNVACDNNSGTNGRTSRVSFEAKAGTPYFVAVDGVNGATGIVYLNYALLKPIALTSLSMTPAGDFRIQAQVTPEVALTLQRTTNLTSWSTIFTNLSTNSSFQYIDSGARSAAKASYRLLQKP